MLNCKSFGVTEAERKHVWQRARFQQHQARSVIKFFFLARQGAEGNARHSDRNIKGTYTIVCHRQNWVAQFNVVIFPPVLRIVLDDPKQWPPRGLYIKFTSLILEHRQISAKSIAEQLGISRERVGLGPSFMKIWTCGSSPRSGSRNAWMRIKNVAVPVVWTTFGIFSLWFPVGRDWWPWTKPGYITMTRGQSNNQWNGGIAALPAPKSSKCKNPLEKFSPRFFGIKTTSSSLIIFQKAKLSTLSISVLVLCSQMWSCSCTTIPRLNGHLPPRRNWPIWASKHLITYPILWIWPRRSTTCSVEWKNIWKVAIFVQRGCHCCRGDLVGRTICWIFLSDLQKSGPGLRRVLSFVGSMLNKSRVCSL